MKTSKQLILFLFVLSLCKLQAQTVTPSQFCEYIQRVGFYDYGAAIEPTPDGGFVVVGNMMESGADQDLYFAKFDASYNLVVTKRIGDNSLTIALYTDIARSIVVAPDAYFIIGESTNTGATPNSDVFVARIDAATYNIDWANRYNSGKNEFGIKGVLAPSPTGGTNSLIVVGQTNPGTDYDIFAMKLNTSASSQGSIISLNMYKVFNNTANEYATDIIKLNGLNEYIISGKYTSSVGNEDILWFKISDNLTIVPGNTPFRTTGTMNDNAFGMEEIGNNVYLVGKTQTWGTGTNDDVYVMEINKSNITPTWVSRTYAINATSIEQVYKCQKTTDGHLVVVGDYRSGSKASGFVMKIRILPGQAQHLTRIWALSLNNVNSNALYNVSASTPNHVFVTGKYGVSANDEDIFISKIYDLAPTTTTCCYESLLTTESSGLSAITVSIDVIGAAWTKTLHKKGNPAGTLVILCKDFSQHSKTNSTVGIDVIDMTEGNQLSLYPNPTEGLFNVKLMNSETIRQIKVMDINGRIIKINQTERDGSTQLDLSKEPNGIYFLEVITDSQKITSKVSVQK